MTADFLLNRQRVLLNGGVDPTSESEKFRKLKRLAYAFDRFLETASDEEIQALENFNNGVDLTPRSKAEALANFDSFLLSAKGTSVISSLRFAATKSTDDGSYFTEGYLFPAYPGGSMCVAVRIRWFEVMVTNEKKKTPKKSEVRLSAGIESAAGLLTKPMQITFKIGGPSGWAQKIYREALKVVEKKKGREASLKVDKLRLRKVVTLLISPEFDRRRNVPLSSLQALYAKFGLTIRETNARSWFTSMGIRRVDAVEKAAACSNPKGLEPA